MMYSIYMESTPNPSVMKFVSNRLLSNNKIEFLNIEDAKGAPLARELFSFPFVKSILVSNNFISITKSEIVEWQNIAGTIREFIIDMLNNKEFKNHFKNEEPLFNIKDPKTNNSQHNTIETKINNILKEYIIPAVESDGGYIEFKAFDKGIVTLSLQGACSGCPSSRVTLKNGIESLLKQKLGEEIKAVRADED